VATLSRVNVGATLTGRVARVNVDEGAQVRRGDVLVQLETSELEAAVAQARAAERQAQARLAGLRSTGRTAANAGLLQAQATVRAAEADLARTQQLVAQGFLSEARLDEARRAVEVARAQQAGAQAQLRANEDNGTDVAQAQAQLAQARAATAAAQQRLARQAQLACVGPDVLGNQHPVMQAITLTVLAARHDGLDPSYAQELVLGGIARAIDKRIVSLESAEMQAGLLVPSDQKQALAVAEQTITQLEKGQARAMLVKVARVWDEGDLEQLSSFEQWCGCADTEDERQFLRRVNDERNGPMAERIDALHTGGRTVFAAVGALHMTGAHGLPQLLQQRGYTVERVRFAPR
jgi:uncharacterized protein YbaP (TraB family)